MAHEDRIAKIEQHLSAIMREIGWNGHPGAYFLLDAFDRIVHTKRKSSLQIMESGRLSLADLARWIYVEANDSVCYFINKQFTRFASNVKGIASDVKRAVSESKAVAST